MILTWLIDHQRGRDAINIVLVGAVRGGAAMIEEIPQNPDILGIFREHHAGPCRLQHILQVIADNPDVTTKVINGIASVSKRKLAKRKIVNWPIRRIVGWPKCTTMQIS